MKKNSMIILASLSLILLASCGQKKKETVTAEKPIAVTVAPAVAQDIAISRTYTGTLEGFKQAKIYSSIPEAVVDLPVTEGRQVQAGQAVILLEKDGPSSRYKQAEAMYLDAKDNYEKMGELFKQGAISEQTYNSLKTNFEVAKANYTAARQQVELTTPISGILTDLSVNIGQYAPLGVPLATVAQTDRMRLTIYIDGRSASFIKNGQQARVKVEGRSPDTLGYVGTVTEVAKSADPDTRQFRVEIQIENKEGMLSPGMYARATIVTSRLENVLTVPKEAVFMIEGISKIYTLAADNRVKEKSITVGESSAEFSQVTSGLQAGENVVVLGRNQVEDGSKVKVVEDLGAELDPEAMKEN